MIKILLISLTATITFGIVDALFFLYAEEDFRNKFHKLFPSLDENTGPILTGGISAATAIFVSSYIATHIKKHTEIIDNPFINSIGILLGTVVIIFIYHAIHNLKKSR